MMRKVLFTASTFSHILNFHLPYLEWFHGQGWSVHVACGGEPPRDLYAERVVSLPFQKSFTAAGNFRAAAQLRQLIREEGYTLISTHTSLAAFFTRLAVKGMRERPPVASTVHGYLFDDDTPVMERRVLLAAERLVAPQTDLLMTMNQWDDQLARRERLGRRVARIPGMGVDFSRLERQVARDGMSPRRAWGVPEDAFVLLYPAEFSPRKSQAVLIRAMAKLPERCVLALPGQGALRGDCEALAAELGLEDRVLFPGQVAGMGPWYAMADALVSASRSEGLPFNVMEAMGIGVPVAASRVKGHTDLIRDGVTGLLYPYGDEDACANAVLTLMASASLRHELARRAREEAARYSLERVLPEVTEQYRLLLPEREPVGAGA